MRISTIQAFNNGVLGIQNNYSSVTRTQEQISSGKRILTPADDPVASVRLLQLDQQASKLEQYKGNLDAANNSLSQEEATLNSVNNLLQRVREITLEAGNGAYTKAERQALAQELAQREEELYGLMNSQNARGEYLFGGYSGAEQPFVKDSAGNYSYRGDEGQRLVQIANSKQIAINDNGKDLFVDISNVNRVSTAAPAANSGDARISLGVVEDKAAFDGYFPAGVDVTLRVVIGGYQFEKGGDIFADANGDPVTFPLEPNDANSNTIRFQGVVVTLDGEPAVGDSFTITAGTGETSSNRERRSLLESVKFLREELETGGDTTDAKLQRRDVLSVSLQNLDNAMNKILGVQTSIGARMNVIESTGNENAEVSLINTTVKSGLEDLDYAEALSKLSLQSVVLQAAQQSFVKVSGLSLFNLLR
ncbi:MAG TPA: flagellar hook-associated protein 3 [Pseudomonas xinjiangensis]|uniref:Flagellar hook-associated protein 3 n=2 Tax=root TaxID=1 RepID=A0A7V1BSF3_9GAMM|nr:flagellar hook-associated protein 3 [Halopseudomonas xinjiangensis]HEC46202.1 flagellar hook-associated protein 3 [Halopseudomonas xinjiangensis]